MPRVPSVVFCVFAQTLALIRSGLAFVPALRAILSTQLADEPARVALHFGRLGHVCLNAARTPP